MVLDFFLLPPKMVCCLRRALTAGLQLGLMAVTLPIGHAMGTNDLGYPRTGQPRRACPPVARGDCDPLPC